MKKARVGGHHVRSHVTALKFRVSAFVGPQYTKRGNRSGSCVGSHKLTEVGIRIGVAKNKEKKQETSKDPVSAGLHDLYPKQYRHPQEHQRQKKRTNLSRSCVHHHVLRNGG